MKNKFNLYSLKLVIIIVFLFVFYFVFPQNGKMFSPVNSCLIEKNEKVYVQLDKECYISGQTINYNSFIVNASNLTTEGASEIVYFEILNNRNQLVYNWHGRAVNGISAGSAIIPDTISYGIYKLKAFTNWMRNFSPELCFSKHIVITRINEKNQRFMPFAEKENKEPLISFFPEGGDLIEGFDAKVAYRINKTDSSNSKMLCYIKENDGNIITQFPLSTSGLGFFNFTPVQGKAYYAEIKDSINNSGQFNLPQVSSSGYSLKVQSENGIIKISIKTKTGFQGIGNLKMYGLTRGKILYDTTLSNTSKNIDISLSVKRFKPGITSFVLVGSGNYILNERLVFINENSQPSVNIDITKREFNPGEKVNFNININDLKFEEQANLSFSVSEIPPFKSLYSQGSLIKYFLFDSEILGLPGNFAKNDNLDDADLILLTTTKSQYAWNLYANSECTHLKETNGYILKGKIKKHTTGEPFVKTLVTMACIDSSALLKYCYTDDNGSFLFQLDEYYDNKDIVFQIHGYPRTQNDVEWEFDNKRGGGNGTLQSVFTFNEAEINYLNTCKSIYLIEKVFQQKQQKQQTATTIVNGNFFGNPDEIVYPAEFTELIDFNDIAANIVPGIKFRAKSEKSYMQVYDLIKHEIIADDAFVILNGIPYDDLSYIATLGTRSVKRIEIVQSVVLYGDLTCPGIVSIFTFNGKIPDNYYNSSKYIYKNEIKSFQSGKYNGNGYNSQGMPNLRQSLYWNPQVLTNKNYSAEFYTSDLKGKFNISVKGITNNGQIIEKSAIIEVK